MDAGAGEAASGGGGGSAHSVWPLVFGCRSLHLSIADTLMDIMIMSVNVLASFMKNRILALL
jgi:hypothetical protein